MKNASHYELLILKELEETLSENEAVELQVWLTQEKNQKFYQEQTKLWSSVEDLQKMKRIDKTKALQRVEKQLFANPFIVRLRKLERVAAILFIPLLIALAWQFSGSILSENKQIVYNTLEVPLGVKSSATLPDGTKVWLNSGSHLKYPLDFNGKTRTVELSGEAYFEVTKNKKCPFIVHTSDIDIEVLGTVFNCNAYQANKVIETSLIEGKVQLSGESIKKDIIMTPGELVIYSKDGDKIKKGKTNLDKYVAWKYGKLMFRDDSMDKVIDKLGRWYGVEFHIEDQEILDYVYSATFVNESLDQVLKMLSLSAPIEFELLPRIKSKNNTYINQIIKLKKRKNMN